MRPLLVPGCWLLGAVASAKRIVEPTDIIGFGGLQLWRGSGDLAQATSNQQPVTHA